MLSYFQYQAIQAQKIAIYVETVLGAEPVQENGKLFYYFEGQKLASSSLNRNGYRLEIDFLPFDRRAWFAGLQKAANMYHEEKKRKAEQDRANRAPIKQGDLLAALKAEDMETSKLSQLFQAV